MATERKVLFKVEVVLRISEFPSWQLTAIKFRVTTQIISHSELVNQGAWKGGNSQSHSEGSRVQKNLPCVTGTDHLN